MIDTATAMLTADAPSATAAAPRLTRLELHGFKSFANRTVFLFEPGITAIIGPNGSGKSNISDGVRWVLGETSHSALRSKRTEDVIFVGGQGRAPAGMAEVAVTFDNGTGWLPTEFAEVTVTRRAYRTGENHYLINGRKVRLKDVAYLTASLGHSHTVVGQGLVDSALSQRAEERRGLFEHAADLTGLRMKAAEAAKSLAETEVNSARVSDLLSELEPRLKTLERAARQAKEWKGFHDRLRALQRMHFARLLAAATKRLGAAEHASSRESGALDVRRAEVETLAAAISTARIALEDARAALARHQARLQSATDQARRIGHERDLANERHAALTRRRGDMAETQAGLDEQVATVERDLTEVARDIAGAAGDVTQARETVSAMQAETATSRAARSELERQAATLARTLGDQDRRLADLTRRQALFDQRRETDEAERLRATAAAAERGARLDRLQGELTAFEEAEATGDGRLTALDADLARLAGEVERAAMAERVARGELSAVERRIGQAASRLEALRRIQESGAGLHGGVRETTQAAKKGALAGIRGTVAELIQVPARFDTAIEVALGGHLQDIVVERWADAEAAIAHLKRSGAGRATFQPLDTVRASRNPAPPTMDGVHGVASDLVSAPDDVRAVVSALLGRTIVVDDLAAARASLPRLAGGWSAVTLAGEVARSGGSVTGGAAVRESGMLGREREVRELPGAIAALERERGEASAALRLAAEEPGRLGELRRAAEAERAGLIASRKERQVQRARLLAWIADVTREQAEGGRRLAALANAAETLRDDLATLAREQAAVRRETASTGERHGTALTELTRDAESARIADEALGAEQRRLAAAEERLRAERKRDAGLRAQRQALGEELGLRAERTAMLDGEIAAIASQQARLGREAEAAARERQRIDAERAPLDTAVKAADGAAVQSERASDAARSALLEAERRRGESGLGVERARGELAAIRGRVVGDLELDDPDLLLTPEGKADDAWRGTGEPPEGTDEIEREIGRLKERLRRVGYVGENVVEEYEREAERHVFLRAQLDDIHGAAASLHTLLAGLHETMDKRFDETFAKVSAVFSEMFTHLFGGGAARLVMTAGEEGAGGAGIDIVAQPPGKRLQSLALLSGGERSLTAVALLFAILRVNPTPFCLLDEVDAALDESNVVRFRDQLRRLASETQAIVITHNRGTVEVADTLYGVSMRDDGVSQVLSLRLADVPVGGWAVSFGL